MDTDMDVVLAFKKLKAETKHNITTRWVMGHALEKKKDKDKVSEMEWVNDDCDNDANAQVARNEYTPPFEPLPGFRAMLKIGDDWITTRFRDCVRFANTAPDMVAYVITRLGIGIDDFHQINWKAIGKVRSHHKFARIVRTSKMMYRWLPVGHNWRQCNLPSHRCPCCGANDETFQHLLQCKREELRLVRESAILDLRTLSKADGIPVLFMSNVIAIIRHVTDSVPIPSSFPHEAIERAVLKQADIGYYHFVVGFLSTEWTAALEELKVDQPERKMEKILATLWDSLCEEIWMTRNGIRHSKENCVSSDELETMAEKLAWYRRHQNTVLDYRHRYLAENNDTTIAKWSAPLRRAQLALLDSARQHYETDLEQRRGNQTTIMDWYSKFMKLRSGRFIGPGIRVIQSGGTVKEATSDVENEFEWDPRSHT